MGESMGGSMIESRGESMVGSMGGSMIESRGESRVGSMVGSMGESMVASMIESRRGRGMGEGVRSTECRVRRERPGERLGDEATGTLSSPYSVSFR